MNIQITLTDKEAATVVNTIKLWRHSEFCKMKRLAHAGEYDQAKAIEQKLATAGEAMDAMSKGIREASNPLSMVVS